MLLKFNLVRKSYFFNKFLFRKITNLYNLVKRKKRKIKRKKRNFVKTNQNYLYILMRPNNTFVTLTGAVKLHLVTGGLSGFKGPKRSSPYSRHVVARNMSYYIFINKIQDPIDLYFNSMITKKFFFFFKGLVFKPLNVRYIIRNKMISHGFLRQKKKRRK